MKHAEFLQTLKDMTFDDLLEAYLEAKVGRYVTLQDECPTSFNDLADEIDNELFGIIETLKAADL